MKKKFGFNRNGKFSGLIKLLKVMKLTVFLLLFSVAGVLANKSYSQSKILNLNMREATVKEVLKSIEEQSEFYFLYSESLIDVERKVNVTIENKKIEQALDLIFEGTDVDYSIRDHIIVLTTSEVRSGELKVLQQQKTVSGKVTDSDGSPLPGVTVLLKGTTKGTVTDSDGNYFLSNISSNATLILSFVGMKTVEKTVNGNSHIDVRMEEEAIGINEVVAIGYGTKLKGELTGSLAKLNSDQIESRPVTGTLEALQGLIPGMTITRQSGKPGRQDYDLKIRGTSSTNGNVPLVLIDGIPVTST